MPKIRAAEESDIPDLAEALSQAFYGDPVLTWVLRGGGGHPEALRRFFTHMLKESAPYGEVMATDELDACAVWVPPGVWAEPPGPLETMRMLPEKLRWTGLGRLRRFMEMDAAEYAKRPRERHYYLAILGVHPSRQGAGLGSALLDHTLSKLDVAGLPAYLENSNPANIQLYERHGFKVVGRITMPRGGPDMWCMWREPKPSPRGFNKFKVHNGHVN
jgi:ribosomal protein S18 acetylase RimI-like enzyme